MEQKNKLKIVLEKTNMGYSVYAPDVEGIFTVGDDLQEIRENLEEVIEIQADFLEEKGKHNEAEKLRSSEIAFYLDVQQFFEHYSMLNKSAFAQYIGMNESHLRKVSKGLMPLSDKKALQIQNGLHQLATEFRTVHFAW